MQSIPILELELARVKTLLHLINRMQIDRKVRDLCPFIFVFALAPYLHAALVTEIAVHVLVATLIVRDLSFGGRAHKLEVCGWIRHVETGEAGFVTHCTVAAGGGWILELRRRQRDYVPDEAAVTGAC